MVAEISSPLPLSNALLKPYGAPSPAVEPKPLIIFAIVLGSLGRGDEESGEVMRGDARGVGREVKDTRKREEPRARASICVPGGVCARRCCVSLLRSS